VITYFWFFLITFHFLKKKRRRSRTRCRFKRHCACSFSLRMQRQGRGSLIFPVRHSLSLHSTCPRKPALPIPTIPCQHKKKKEGTMPRGGYAKAAPRHLTLYLDRVGWPSPPDSYKYRGECRSREKRKKRKPRGGKNFGEREKGNDREGRRLGGSAKKKGK